MDLKIPKKFVQSPDISGKGENKTEVETVKLLITDENGNEIVGYARFTMPEDSGEKLIKAEFTTNIMEDLELTSDFWEAAVLADKSGATNKSSCIASCHTTYTNPTTGEKLKGRGWCKAQCWATAVASAVAAVAVAIIAS